MKACVSWVRRGEKLVTRESYTWCVCSSENRDFYSFNTRHPVSSRRLRTPVHSHTIQLPNPPVPAFPIRHTYITDPHVHAYRNRKGGKVDCILEGNNLWVSHNNNSQLGAKLHVVPYSNIMPIFCILKVYRTRVVVLVSAQGSKGNSTLMMEKSHESPKILSAQLVQWSSATNVESIYIFRQVV